MGVNTVCEVVIIGGGVAGLFAARTLVESGRYAPSDIVILEAQSCLGGRIHTKWVDGIPLEMGAQWIHGRGENPLWKYAIAKGIPISDTTNTDGQGIFLSQSGQKPPEDILTSTLNFLEEVHHSVYDVLDEKGSLITGYPSSVGEFYKSQFDNWLSQFQGVESEENIRWRKSIYNWKILWENCDCGCNDLNDNSIYTFASYEDYEGGNASFAFGYDSFVNSVVNEVKGRVKILLNKEVTKVSKDDRTERMYVECANGTKVESKTVLVTLSLGVLKSSMHLFDYQTITWPSSVLRAIHHIAFGSISYVKMEFENKFWEDKYPGVMILRDTVEEVKPFEYEYEDTWINYIYGFDTVLHQPNMLMAWLSGEQSRAMERESDGEIGEQLVQLLQRVMSTRGIQVPIKLKNIHVTRWNQNKFVRGTYSYATKECVQKGIRHSDLCTPILHSSSGRIALMLAGEATSDEAAGSVHGALMSGVAQAKRILETSS